MGVNAAPAERAFAAGYFDWHFDDNTRADYLNRFGINIEFIEDVFAYSAQNGSEHFDFGVKDWLLKFNHRDVSTLQLARQLGLTFVGAATTNTHIPIMESFVIPVAPGPYTITLSQTPDDVKNVTVHGLIGGIDTFYGYEATPISGCFKISAGTTVTFNAAQAGLTVYIDYFYVSAAIGKTAATTPQSFIPSAVSGEGFIRLGPQNVTRAKWLVLQATNWVRAGGAFDLVVDKNKIHTGMDLTYSKSSSSDLAWYLD